MISISYIYFETGLSIIINAVKKNRTLKFILALLVLLLFTLFFIPLIRDADYEFQAITGAFVFWGIAYSVISISKHHSKNRTGMFQESAASVMTESAGFTLLLVLVALFVSGIGVIIRNCCIGRSLIYFLLLPCISAVSGLGLGLFIVSVLKRFRYPVLYMIMMLSLLYNFFCVVAFPPVSVYSYFWGYFAGPVYDDWIPVDATLITHRALSFIFAAGLIMLARILFICRERGLKVIPVLLTLIWIGSGFFVFHSGRLGFLRSGEDLTRELSQTRSFGAVVCHADPALDEETVAYLSRLAEFHYRDLTEQMELREAPEIRIFIYRDHEQKKKLIGAGRTNIARIWNNEIHINAQDAEDVMRHEMVHLLANEFGHPLFSSLSAVMLEGTAVANGDDDGLLTPHQWARILQKKERLPDMNQLMRQRIFFTTATRLSYTVAGSFCRYLMDYYPVSRFKTVYRSLDFEREYGKPLAMLIDEWKSSLKHVPVDSADSAFADMLLQPSYTEKPCFHAVAGAIREIRQMTGKGELDHALPLTERALKKDPGHMLLHWLKTRCLQQMGRYPEAGESAEETLSRGGVHPAWRARLSVLRADMAFLAGAHDKADSLYLAAQSEFGLFAGIYLETIVRRHLLNRQPGILKNHLTEPFDADSVRMPDIEPAEDSLLNLWAGKLYYDSGDWLRAAYFLQRTEPADSILELSRCRMLTGIYSRTGNIRCALKYNERSLGFTKREADSVSVVQERRFLLRLDDSGKRKVIKGNIDADF